MSVRVLLADDHVIVRQGLRQLLIQEGYNVVGEATDGREAVRLAQELHPDIAIVDLAMPILNGLDATRQILKVSPSTKAIVLTLQKEGQYATEAFRAGIKGYVVKTYGATELCKAIQEVIRGSIYLSPDIAEVVYQARTESLPSHDPLTPREREVLQLIAEGKTMKEIAMILEISSNTVESHRARIMNKLNIHEKAGLVRYAIRRGLTHP